MTPKALGLTASLIIVGFPSLPQEQEAADPLHVFQTAEVPATEPPTSREAEIRDAVESYRETGEAAARATDLPALLVEAASGEMGVSNYRLQGSWYVVDDLFQRVELAKFALYDY